VSCGSAASASAPSCAIPRRRRGCSARTSSSRSATSTTPRRSPRRSRPGPEKVAQEAAVVDAAAAAGVELIVKASALDARAGHSLLGLDYNGRGEDHLRRSGVPAVMLQSGFYMTNLLLPGAFTVPAADGRVAMIDPRDIGAAGAVALTTEGHAGATYRLTGGESITYEQAAAALGAEYVDVPPAAAQAGLEAAGLPDWLVTHMMRMFELIRAGWFDRTTDTVRALTGREPRTIHEFARGVVAASAAAGQL
jgi:NAD(P)H dehydrogenase (quinone)